VLVTIVNHQHNANAVALKSGFAPLARAVLIDSGSQVEPEYAASFDRRLPNVYYSGLLNSAFELASALKPSDPMLFICSDVVVSDAAVLVARVESAFSDPGLQVYAPASRGSSYAQMWPRQSRALRKVSFVEGFCFAARRQVLARLCPVDVAVNCFGYGLDMYLGYEALRLGGYSAVDDAVEVHHPVATGYDSSAAVRQQDAWSATLPQSARRFMNLAQHPAFRSGPGRALLRVLCAQ
jgi:hypothetical protein